MNFLKKLFSKGKTILEVDLCISDSSYCKIVRQTVSDDFHIMLTSLLVYGRVLSILNNSKRTALTTFFIELPQLNKSTNITIADVMRLATNTNSSTNSKTRVKLIEHENGIKTIHVGTLYNTDIAKYATLMFGFGLGKILESTRENLLAAFIMLSEISNRKKLTVKDATIYPYQILNSLVNDTE